MKANLFHNDEVAHLYVRALHLDSPCRGKVLGLEQGRVWGAVAAPPLPSFHSGGEKWEMFPPQELGNAAPLRFPEPSAPTKGWVSQKGLKSPGCRNPQPLPNHNSETILQLLFALLTSPIQKYPQHQADEQSKTRKHQQGTIKSNSSFLRCLKM